MSRFSSKFVHHYFKFIMTDLIRRKERPLILITNDDGIQARGIHALAQTASSFGDVVVVAPDAPRSGQSAAITVNVPLRITPVNGNSEYREFSINGTPVDCVKLAMSALLEHRPDLVLSGINHGSNSAVNELYSGTMGGVFEGVMQNIPSVGFSLCSHKADADFSNCRPIVEKIIRSVLSEGLPKNIGLNVNIPTGEVKGIRVCRAARGYWTDEYEHRIDPAGRSYYWLTGRFLNTEPDAEDTDEYHLSRGYATIVPCTADRSAIPVFPGFKALEQ